MRWPGPVWLIGIHPHPLKYVQVLFISFCSAHHTRQQTTIITTPQHWWHPSHHQTFKTVQIFDSNLSPFLLQGSPVNPRILLAPPAGRRLNVTSRADDLNHGARLVMCRAVEDSGWDIRPRSQELADNHFNRWITAVSASCLFSRFVKKKKTTTTYHITQEPR